MATYSVIQNPIIRLIFRNEAPDFLPHEDYNYEERLRKFVDSDVPYSISEESISDLINRGDNQLKFGLKGEAMNCPIYTPITWLKITMMNSQFK